MIRIPAEVTRRFSLPVSPEAAFGLMRDVPAWGAFFPNVAHITPLAESVWRWEMKPLGPPGLEAQNGLRLPLRLRRRDAHGHVDA